MEPPTFLDLPENVMYLLASKIEDEDIKSLGLVCKDLSFFRREYIITVPCIIRETLPTIVQRIDEYYGIAFWLYLVGKTRMSHSYASQIEPRIRELLLINGHIDDLWTINQFSVEALYLYHATRQFVRMNLVYSCVQYLAAADVTDRKDSILQHFMVRLKLSNTGTRQSRIEAVVDYLLNTSMQRIGLILYDAPLGIHPNVVQMISELLVAWEQAPKSERGPEPNLQMETDRIVASFLPFLRSRCTFTIGDHIKEYVDTYLSTVQPSQTVSEGSSAQS